MLLFLCREGVEFSRRLEASIEQNFTSQIIPHTCKEGLVEEEVAQLSPAKFLVLNLFKYRLLFNLFIGNIWS